MGISFLKFYEKLFTAGYRGTVSIDKCSLLWLLLRSCNEDIDEREPGALE
jgi:hypothetical protein